jgi:predicted NBD/HSP70 family sugar kinase
MTPTIDGTRLLNGPDTPKEQTRQRILRCIMLEPTTQTRLVKMTNLSAATVSTTVRELSHGGIVRLEGEGDRLRRIRLGPVRGAAVGIDLGYSHLTVLVRPLERDDAQSVTVARGAQHGADSWVRDAKALVEQKLAEVGLTIDDVVTVGVGVPAGIDPRTGMATLAVDASGWDPSERPGQKLEAELGVHVVVDNDANVGAYGEHLFGAGRDAESVVYVKVGTGIGAGLVVGELIQRGRRGISMELGHLNMDRDGIICRCGKRGCLETIIGSFRLLDQIRQAHVGYRADFPVTIDGIIERARARDRICRRVLEEAARTLGFALAQVCTLIDPDVIAIGGNLSRAEDLVGRVLQETFRRYTVPHENPEGRTRVMAAQLGKDAQVRGALALGLTGHRAAQEAVMT